MRMFVQVSICMSGSLACVTGMCYMSHSQDTSTLENAEEPHSPVNKNEQSIIKAETKQDRKN